MRFLQIASFYPNYLNDFYRRHPKVALGSFDIQLKAILDDGFSAVHLLAPYMNGCGFEASLIIANALQAQARWALDHGLAAPGNHHELRALVAKQIEIIKPDILYLIDPITYDGRFLAELSHRPKLVMGWRAANIPAGTTWHGFDVMLSSDEGCRRRALDLGATRAANYRPGFPREIAERVADTPKSSDIVFCGQMTGEHQHRMASVVGLLNDIKASRTCTTALHLGLSADPRIPAALRSLDKGAVWGMDMYRAVRAGRIAPNFHIDLAASKGQNMRILETVGVGTFLLTEHDPELAERFVVGREIETYASQGELLEKIIYYLDHAEEREAIAKRGQMRCFADHSMQQRAKVLADLIAEHLKYPRVSQHLKPSTESDVSTAAVYLGQGKLDEAAALLTAELRAHPQNAQALHLMGRLAFLAGETASAVQLCQSALSLQLPQEFAVVCAADMAAALVKLGRAEEAVALLREAYVLQPSNHDVGARLAALLALVGQPDEAELVGARLPKSRAKAQLDTLMAYP
jgi:Flp pilus assembly protein TadD